MSFLSLLILAQDAAPSSAPAVPPIDLQPGTAGEGLGRLGRITHDVVSALPAVGVGLIVLFLFVIVASAIKFAVSWYAGRRLRRGNLALAVGRLVNAITLVVGVLVACVIVFPNFTPTGLLTSLGVGSLVLGLAFKDVLQNYMAGILLLIAEPFRPGDQIIFQGFEGTVEQVQPRATFIRTYDGRRAVVPNAQLFTNPLTVNTAFESRRVEYDVGIGYGDDIDRAKAIILRAIRDTKTALDEPAPEVLTYELAPSTVNLRVRWWIQPPVIRELFDARDQVLATIKNQLTEAGIDLAFPTTQVLFHDQTDEDDGVRGRQREGWPPPHDGAAPAPRRGAGGSEEQRQNGAPLSRKTR